ncbi:ABC transporter ATP-binding protein [Pseudomonas syringae pv. cilantro]|uniref:ABC transporter ATP-binding protein n=2 Tax=Pseudomonas syringae group TaxID=136849 RepID=A0A0N0XDG6_PSESX|nr:MULTISPECIES: hypothetical protein [Pseudomonas syringae group]KPC33565.1 ABC transporter ATP-binding protein [Pseudomonas syringae pv. cilantro]RMN15496.1 ABC transporter ATP-binding protein [Pseudomonas syringae pv. coriandricola]
MTDAPQLIDIRHLGVAYRFYGQINQAVRNVSFQVAQGETVTIVGESGSICLKKSPKSSRAKLTAASIAI